MDPLTATAAATQLLKPIADLLDKLHLSGEEKLQAMLKIAEMQRDVIVAEAKSEHWMTSIWRPVLMLTCVTILANNWIIAPYVSAIFGVDIALPIPPEMWKLLYMGVGGYIGGRTVEKVVRNLKEK